MDFFLSVLLLACCQPRAVYAEKLDFIWSVQVSIIPQLSMVLNFLETVARLGWSTLK